MRLLADENFPLPTIEALRHAGHDVAWARTDEPGAKDTALLNAAEQEGRILLTSTRISGRSRCKAAAPLERGGVILFRVHPAIPQNITPLVIRTIGAQAEWSGHAAVVTVDRVLMFRPKGRG